MSQTQGDTVIEALKLYPHTYAEMLNICGGGIAPWKRCVEALDQPRWKGWKLTIGKRLWLDGKYLKTWRVVRVKK